MDFHKSPVQNFRHTQSTYVVKQDKHTSVDMSTQRGCSLYLVEHAQEAGQRSSRRNMTIWVVVRRSSHHLFQPYRLSPNMASAGEISDESVCMVILEPERDEFQASDVHGRVTACVGMKKYSRCTFWRFSRVRWVQATR